MCPNDIERLILVLVRKAVIECATAAVLRTFVFRSEQQLGIEFFTVLTGYLHL